MKKKVNFFEIFFHRFFGDSIRIIERNFVEDEIFYIPIIDINIERPLRPQIRKIFVQKKGSESFSIVFREIWMSNFCVRAESLA